MFVLLTCGATSFGAAGCGQAQESHSAAAAGALTQAAFAASMRGAELAPATNATRHRGAAGDPQKETENASFNTTAAPHSATTRCPSGMVLVGDYCIDRYEAYVVELDASDRESAHSPYTPVDGLRVRAKVAGGVVPQGYISQVQAREACENAGKRLCSAPEFSLACRGPDEHASYPYGGTRRQPGKCNEGKGSAVSVVFGAAANYGNLELNDPRLNQWSGGLAKTGAFAESASPFGVFDLVGNLHEWSAEVAPNGHGFFHGGFYGDAEVNGAGCNYVTKAHATNYHDYSTGFRCCKDAEAARGDGE
jgi:sulfatase modifying factor 1